MSLCNAHSPIPLWRLDKHIPPMSILCTIFICLYDFSFHTDSLNMYLYFVPPPPNQRKTWYEQKMVQSCICYHGSDLTANGLTAVIKINLPPSAFAICTTYQSLPGMYFEELFYCSLYFLYHAYHYLIVNVNFSSSVGIVVILEVGLPGHRNWTPGKALCSWSC
jgi:hypothetical protein